VGAVPVPVDGVTVLHSEVRPLGYLAANVRVAGVDAGVQHRDPYAAAVVPGRPRLRRGHLSEVGVEPAAARRRFGDPHPVVQPDLDGGRSGRPRRRPIRTRGQRAREACRLRLGKPAGDGADARQVPDLPEVGGDRGCPDGAARGSDDQRQLVGARVVVPFGDQCGDVEQRLIEHVAEQRHHVARHDPYPPVRVAAAVQHAARVGRPYAHRGGVTVYVRPEGSSGGSVPAELSCADAPLYTTSTPSSALVTVSKRAVRNRWLITRSLLRSLTRMASGVRVAGRTGCVAAACGWCDPDDGPIPTGRSSVVRCPPRHRRRPCDRVPVAGVPGGDDGTRPAGCHAR
jgi:hypothetical protein